MRKKRLPMGFLVVTVLVLGACSFVYAAEQASVEGLVRGLTPPLAVTAEKEEEKDRWYYDAYFEPGDVLQGTKRGHWNELDYTFGYIHKNITGYMWVSQQERFDVKNNAAAWGSYINLDKDQYIHYEAGFGWNTTYLYQLQTTGEYGHRLYENLFGQVVYTYRSYRGSADDTHLVSPGLIYYFGDSYLSANYGASYMESHDTASIGVFKGDFAITKFLRWNCGVAFGGRLYDILGKDAKDEQGYILFTGVNVNLYKGIGFKFGYIYGTEDPKFIKRSLYYAVSAKF